MGTYTAISWCDHTFNTHWGCSKISPACTHCYAETWAKRTGYSIWGPNTERRFFGPKHWQEPITWNRWAQTDGVRRRVFCSSMADVFERRDDLDAVRAQLYELILATPWLDWLLLTKRPENCLSMSKWDEWPDNVWLGTTVESPEYYWRIRELCKNVAPVHFISAEPLLADLASIPLAGIQWVICGGESGPNFRTMNPDWARSLRDQCTLANVAFHFKQWGGLKKKPKTGRLLDERTWDEVPCR